MAKEACIALDQAPVCSNKGHSMRSILTPWVERIGVSIFTDLQSGNLTVR